MYFCILAMNDPKKETKKAIPFTIAPKTIEHLGINLTKAV